MAPLPHVALVKLRQRDAGFKLPEGLGAKGAAEPAIQEIAEKTRYLNGHHYLQISNVKEINAYQLRERLRQIPNAPISDFQFETMPLLTPTSIAPNDTLFPQQWDMTRIEAGGPGTTGWDITTGAATTVVCVLDEGCDLTHPDLLFAAPGINLGTMSGDGSPTGNHGTACAGIVAATYNNGTGVTGVAGDARILPVAFDAWTDVEVAAGINYASANGASIISMSFGWNGWSPAIIDPANPGRLQQRPGDVRRHPQLQRPDHLPRHQPAGDRRRRLGRNRQPQNAGQPGWRSLGLQLRPANFGSLARRTHPDHRPARRGRLQRHRL